MSMRSEMLVVTMGDPLSVNVELVETLLPDLKAMDCPVVIVGSAWQWRHQAKGLPGPLVRGWEETGDRGLWFLDPFAGNPTLEVPTRQLSARDRGVCAVGCLDMLRQLPPTRRLAVITAPIDKAACRLAGFAWPGQTEFFEHIWDDKGIMILAGPRLRVGLVTNHEPLALVPGLLSRDLIRRKALLFRRTLQRVCGLPEPAIAVCGLNPHCGDGGLFGDEENRLIVPAVEEAALQVPGLKGPLPADTVFHQALQGQWDGVLAMYHDQGLGPLKTVHFFDAINITGGLNHLRVSPDHGPAADLFLRGEARPDSMATALRYAGAWLDAPGAEPGVVGRHAEPGSPYL